MLQFFTDASLLVFTFWFSQIPFLWLPVVFFWILKKKWKKHFNTDVLFLLSIFLYLLLYFIVGILVIMNIFQPIVFSSKTVVEVIYWPFMLFIRFLQMEIV